MLLIDEVEKISGVPRSKIYRRYHRRLYPFTVKLIKSTWTRFPADLPKWVVMVEYLIFFGWKDEDIRAFTRGCAEGFKTKEELIAALAVFERLDFLRAAMNHGDAMFRKGIVDGCERGTVNATSQPALVTQAPAAK